MINELYINGKNGNVVEDILKKMIAIQIIISTQKRNILRNIIILTQKNIRNYTMNLLQSLMIFTKSLRKEV